MTPFLLTAHGHQRCADPAVERDLNATDRMFPNGDHPLTLRLTLVRFGARPEECSAQKGAIVTSTMNVTRGLCTECGGPALVEVIEVRSMTVTDSISSYLRVECETTECRNCVYPPRSF